MVLFFIRLFIGLLLLAMFLGVWRTWQVEKSPNQALFVGGHAPTPAPDGLYHGTVPGRKVSWLGKKFDAAKSSGINVFDDGNGVKGERYPFTTSYTKGVRDKNVDVLAINYNVSANPVWLRFILDEVVEVAPGEYLGKLHLRIIPGYPFTLGYFKLLK